MDAPEWYRPGAVVRLKPTLAASLDDFPQTAVLGANPDGGSALIYPRPDGQFAYVRPEHLEPVEGETRKINFREFL